MSTFLLNSDLDDQGSVMDYLETLKSSIVDVIDDFRSNPFDFLYEADIQAALFAEARKRFYPEKVEMKGGYLPPEFYPEGYVVKTTPVKCEYPSGQRFDIAVIDHLRAEHYERARWQEKNWKSDRFWGQPLRAAVEIKYMQLGDRPNHRRAGLLADLSKLRGYRNADPQFSGIAMLFVQSDLQYSEMFCKDMTKLEGISEVDNGIYAAVIGPSKDSWYVQ